MTLRLLTPADKRLLDEFLALHRDSSMFLRANARRAGLTYCGEPLQAIYGETTIAVLHDGYTNASAPSASL